MNWRNNLLASTLKVLLLKEITYLMKDLSTQSDAAVLASNSANEEEYEQPTFSRRDTLLTMLGVLMVMLLASLDQTSPLL